MVDLQVITNTGANTVLTEALVEEFQTAYAALCCNPAMQDTMTLASYEME